MAPIMIPEHSPFPVTNLPLGIGRTTNTKARAWTAIGDSALDLSAASKKGLFSNLDLPTSCFGEPSLNTYLSFGPETWAAVRRRLQDALSDARLGPSLEGALVPRSDVEMAIPTRPVDFVDFYSSIHHATNLGRLFRPDGEALLPNWRHIPVGYHGRTSTLVPHDAKIKRPRGIRVTDGQPEHGPCRLLDIELEVGTVVGVGNPLGAPIDIADADKHLYGMCLVNDWSARDIQTYEYQPLGPFLGKSFATSVSPWLVSMEALEPFRVMPPSQDPKPADYLITDVPWGVDLHLEVQLQSAKMQANGQQPMTVSQSRFHDMYWTPAQQLAHMTVNGASTSAGDLFASGTVSGPEPGTEGSFIELTWLGERPLELPDGTTRTFLQDGDRVELRGWAGDDPATRIGIGAVAGTITSATGDN